VIRRLSIAGAYLRFGNALLFPGGLFYAGKNIEVL